MKKLLPIILFLSLASYTQAQVACTESAPDATGVYPSTLPDACVGTAYNEVITFVLPNDTCMNLGGPSCTNLTFNSATINSANLPDGLGYDCPDVSCSYSPDVGSYTKGCVTISGTPTTSGTASYSITVTVNYSGINYPYTFDLDMTVHDAGTNGCPVVSSTLPEYLQEGLTASPNPTKGIVKLNNTITNAVLYDVMGNTIITKKTTSRLDLSNLNPGLYFLSCDQGTLRITKE